MIKINKITKVEYIGNSNGKIEDIYHIFWAMILEYLHDNNLIDKNISLPNCNLQDICYNQHMR